MKINRFVLEIIKKSVLIDINRRRKLYPPHGIYRERLDIPFIDDKENCHKYDVYLANENNRKRICVIDIHGGSYMFSEHQDNYWIATKFLERGIDFVCVDYMPNDGSFDTIEQVSDCAININHLYQHLLDYDLQDDIFYLMGDSAGGHFALLLAELFSDKEIQDKICINLPPINIQALLLNCPVFDFAGNMDKSLTDGAMKRMFGKNYTKTKMELISPKTYIKSFKMPLFLSTCKNDFLRKESLQLKEIIEKQGSYMKFLDIYVDKKEIGHVHNVIMPNLHESKIVNKAMYDFIIETSSK